LHTFTTFDDGEYNCIGARLRNDEALRGSSLERMLMRQPGSLIDLCINGQWFEQRPNDWTENATFGTLLEVVVRSWM